jgi:integrase
MDPRALLETWLAAGTLRPSTVIEYRREVTSWLDWCHHTHVDPYDFGLEAVARWAQDRHLAPVLAGRPLDGPDALAWLAHHHPDTAKSHDRRITALTGYYTAARNHGTIRQLPELNLLRSGVDRDAEPPRRLTPMERVAFFTCLGGWGPDQARHYLRDRLIGYLLLEGLRPGEIVRLDMRHLYENTAEGTWDVRAPDDFENVGKKFVLEPLTVAALHHYLPKRPRPADGVHAVVLGQGGRPLTLRYPNTLIQQICATHPLLAQRTPPVTADTIAHTGYWDTPAAE